MANRGQMARMGAAASPTTWTFLVSERGLEPRPDDTVTQTWRVYRSIHPRLH